MRTEEKAVHFQISLTLNEDTSWSYNSPKVEKHIQFALPLNMVSGKLLSDYLEKTIENMEGQWGEAVSKHEAEVAAEKAREEAEKVKAEVTA